MDALQLNQSKCEFLLFGSKTQLSKFEVSSISISQAEILLIQFIRHYMLLRLYVILANLRFDFVSNVHMKVLN